MKDVVQILGANSIDANLFSEDMFYFERRIAEITPSNSELEDVRKHEIHTINSLKTIAPSVSIFFLKFIYIKIFVKLINFCFFFRFLYMK